MAKHPELRSAIRQFGRLQDEVFRALDHYHRLSAHERIDRFVNRFETLLHRLTLDIQLLHIRVDDNLFRNYMRAKGRRYTRLRLHQRAMNTPNGGFEDTRSDERRVGQECGSTVQYRGCT